MLCPYCNNFRPTNSESCPRCNAPSPLVGEAGGSSGSESAAGWGQTLPFSAGSDGNDTMASPEGPGGETYDNSLWAQVMAPQVFPPNLPTNGQQQSLLPVPYQPQQAGMVPQQLMTMSPSLPTIQMGNDGGALIPAPPATEPTVHILPMYTKPRPIIPRYRAISGLLSVLIVFGLLCAGASYYAKVTGKLSFLHVIYGDARQQNIKPPPTGHLLVPPNTLQPGPAFNIIPSATTASRFDAMHHVALDHTNVFTVRQTIYLTYSVHPPSHGGSVVLKWYTNAALYLASDPMAVPGGKEETGSVQVQFSQPLEGKVEIYWNNQIAVTLLFVVEPS